MKIMGVSGEQKNPYTNLRLTISADHYIYPLAMTNIAMV